MRAKKHVEEDDGPAGAPVWMVTFSDCMTLLLTFFVLLLSFSSFDERIFRQLKAIFADALPSVAPNTKSERDSFLSTKQIQATAELDEGSEKPTLDKGVKDRTKEETEPVDFHSRKVFLIESKRIFWAKGTVVSSEGRNIMSIMASFLKELPNRIVISENGPGDENNEQFGLARAWSVLQFLTEKQGLDKKRFSISAASTIPQERLENGKISAGQERAIEIVLLERSIYN